VALGAFERMVAWRYLRAPRQEGFVSVIAAFSLLGIALGVATLIIVMAVMNGFRVELLGRILGLNGHLSIFTTDAKGIADYDAVAGAVRQVPGVAEVHAIVEGQVLAASPERSTGALVRGMGREDIAQQKLIAGSLGPGALDRFADDNILIGARLATKLGVAPGGEVTLLSPAGQATAFGYMPRIKTYRVAGTFSVGMFDYDSTFIFMPLSAAQLFFQAPDRATTLQVFVADPDRARVAAGAIAQKLGAAYRIYDWQASNSAYFAAIQIQRNVMFIILSLIVVVAAFNIISSMNMLVNDKTRAIAILRTVGASRAAVLRIFVLSGAGIGIVGTTLGLVLGVLFTTHIEQIREALQRLVGVDLFNSKIYFLTEIPERIDPMEVGLVLAMAFGLSFLATLYPSWRAARLDPVEALRYE
jgi:lipoprotein-releasing system permease protein